MRRPGYHGGRRQVRGVRRRVGFGPQPGVAAARPPRVPRPPPEHAGEDERQEEDEEDHPEGQDQPGGRQAQQVLGLLEDNLLQSDWSDSIRFLPNDQVIFPYVMKNLMPSMVKIGDSNRIESDSCCSI